MGRTRTVTKPKKAFRIEAKFMNWVLNHLPTTDDEEHDSVIQTDDSNTG